ncbi:MAG: hypothetical protein WAT39_13215 [Planctomycetota bacterium]
MSTRAICLRLCLVMLSAFAILAGPLDAQQTWKVHCAGAYGAQFLDLPPALAAASPGDTILVIAGPAYSSCTIPLPQGYTAPLIDKGVNIVGLFVGIPPGNNTPTRAPLGGPINIANIPAGQKLVITNINVQHRVDVSPIGSPITITDCDGTVLIEDLNFMNLGMYGQVFRIERCDNVILRGCSFRLGGAPLFVIDSSVLMTTSFIVYDGPSWFPPWAYTLSTPAMELTRSSVTLVGSDVRGPGVVIAGYPPMAAAVVRNSTLRIGAASTLRGGMYPGAPPGTGWDPYNYTPAYVIHWAFGPSAVEKDPRAPAFNYGLQPPPVLTPIDETFHDWVVADEYYHVRVVGPVNGYALLCVSDMIVPTPSPLGTLGIDPLVAQPISLVALPASTGVYNWTFFCPSQVQNGYAFALQSLTLSTAGTFGLTQPSPLTVAWDKTAYPQ